MKKYFFKKEERLCSRKQIELLFSSGSSFVLYPFRIVWLRSEEPFPYPAQVAISVPKKKFKRAVDRNRIKRSIREAYRKNKEALLYQSLRENNHYLHFIIIYTGNEIFTAEEVEKKLNLALVRLIKEYAKSN
jgi:ribonuclease P protein component